MNTYHNTFTEIGARLGGASPLAPYTKYNTEQEERQVEKEVRELVVSILKLTGKVLILVGAVIGVILIFKEVL